MSAYVMNRVLSSAIVVVLVSILVFLAINVQKGSIIEANLAGSGIVSQSEINGLRHQLKLDRSPIERYYTWWHDMIVGCSAKQSVCYGNSLRVRGISIWSRVGDAMPYTIELLVLSLLVSFVVAVPIGAISAIRQDSLVDYVLRIIAILGVAVPTFFLATVFVIYASRWFGYAPPSHIPYIWSDVVRNIKAFIPPSLLLGYSLSAVTMRITRSSLLEVLHEDFVRTARAKGLAERRVIVAHAFRNAVIPVLTIIGNQAGFLFGGSVIVERIFNIPGMGWLAFQAIFDRDYTQVLATTFVLTLGVVFMNLLVDLFYSVIDPRIRLAS